MKNVTTTILDKAIILIFTSNKEVHMTYQILIKALPLTSTTLEFNWKCLQTFNIQIKMSFMIIHRTEITSHYGCLLLLSFMTNLYINYKGYLDVFP